MCLYRLGESFEKLLQKNIVAKLMYKMYRMMPVL